MQQVKEARQGKHSVSSPLALYVFFSSYYVSFEKM